MKKLYRAAAAAVAALLMGSASAAETCRELCREIQVSYTSGHIDGYAQKIPVLRWSSPYIGDAIDANFNEGLPNSYLERNFNHLGFDGFHQLNYKAKYDYGKNRFYLNYDRTRLDKDYNYPPPTSDDLSGVLSVTGFAPVSIPTDTSTKLDYYRLGYQRLFDFEVFGRTLTLAPGAEMNVLDFEHEFNREFVFVEVSQSPNFVTSPNIGSIASWGGNDGPSNIFGATTVDYFALQPANPSDYTKWGLHVGGEASYQLSERLAINAEIYDTVRIDDWPEVFTAKLGLRYRLYAARGYQVFLHGRGGLETIKLRHADTDWTDLRAEYRDLIEGGISVRF